MNQYGRVLSIAAAVLVLMFGWSPVHSQNADPASPITDYYDSPGLASYRDQIATEDASEHIDPFSGRLNLSYTDIAIPGNGGLDLKIIRSYNNTQLGLINQSDFGAVGMGWDITFGRVLLNSKRGVCDSSSDANKNSSTDHVLQLADGSRHTLYVANVAPFNSHLYVTSERWVASCTTLSDGLTKGLIVTSPEGVSYYMTQYQTSGFPSLMATKIVDRNGNTINIAYVNLGASPINPTAIQSVTTSDGRSVQFHYVSIPYNSGQNKAYHLSTITTGGFTWTYDYDTIAGFVSYSQPIFRLVTVTRPDSSRWQYTYYPYSWLSVVTVDPSSFSVNTVTYPHGAIATYTYQSVNFGYAASSTAVYTKNLTGPSLTPAQWSYVFNPTSAYDETTITGPAVKYVYRHTGYLEALQNRALISQVGSLIYKEVDDPTTGHVFQTESYAWDTQLISGQTLLANGNIDLRILGYGAPILAQHTIVRDGTTYTTSYTNYDPYGNAQSTTENGTAGTRLTASTYLIDTPNWVIHALASKTIANVSNNTATVIGTATNQFDAKDNITSSMKNGVTTTFTYTPEGDIASTTNARGYKTSYSNFKRGIAKSVDQPEGVKLSKAVDAMGHVTSAKNGNGFTTSFSYDGLGRPINVSYPIHTPLSVNWSVGSNRISLSRGAYIESTTVDGLGHPVTIDRSGISSQYTYDAMGRKIHESYDCQQGSTCGERSYVYDALSRVTKVTKNGVSRSFTYAGGTVNVTTERGYHVTYKYSAFGNPDEQMLIALNTPTTTTHATYNAVGLMETISQGGQTRKYSYDDHLFLVTVNNPETGKTKYGRDAIGNITSIAIGSAGATKYKYDGLNRKISTTSVASSSPNAAPATITTYDKDGSVLTINSDCTNITYQYDALDELVNENHQDVCGGPTLGASYDYDALDHLSTTTYPSGRVVNYTPDVWGRPTTASSYVTNASYFPNGYVKSVALGNGSTETQTLTSRLLVNNLSAATSGGVPLVNFTYTYDLANNVTSIADGVTPANGLTMQYDKDDQLILANGGFGSGSVSYDGIGNILTMNLGTAGNVSNTYTSNLLTGVTGSKNYSVTYDAHGNVTYDGNYHYTYNSENRLIAVTP